MFQPGDALFGGFNRPVQLITHEPATDRTRGRFLEKLGNLPVAHHTEINHLFLAGSTEPAFIGFGHSLPVFMTGLRNIKLNFPGHTLDFWGLHYQMQKVFIFHNCRGTEILASKSAVPQNNFYFN